MGVSFSILLKKSGPLLVGRVQPYTGHYVSPPPLPPPTHPPPPPRRQCPVDPGLSTRASLIVGRPPRQPIHNNDATAISIVILHECPTPFRCCLQRPLGTARRTSGRLGYQLQRSVNTILSGHPCFRCDLLYGPSDWF